MKDVKGELIEMLNQALKLEHMARIQYLTHAKLVAGPYSEKLVERLEELASDEAEHESKFRKMISDYLGGVPSMDKAEGHLGDGVESIININLHDERAGIDFYKKIYRKVIEYKDELPYEFDALEHELRHIILDEQEHVVELKALLAKSE